MRARNTVVLAKLAEKVREGGTGVSGILPMAPIPHAKINDADLTIILEAIRKL